MSDLSQHNLEINGMTLNVEPPFVSVIVPVYNASPYLKECVDSILAQTLTNFELMVINDGSSDQSPQICDEYAKLDHRIIVIHKKNEGPSATRNLGLQKAVGKYIVFCDADDVLSPRALEQMYSVMEKYNTDLALCGFSRFIGSIKNSQEMRTLSKYSLTIFQTTQELASVYFQPVTNMFGISIWAKMYRADIIRRNSLKFPEDVNYEEDCCFNVAYFRHVTTAGALRDILYHYRQQNVSLSKGYRANAFDGIVNGYRNRQRFLADIGLAETVKRLDVTFLVATNNNYKKIHYSSLSKAERLEAYQKMLDIPDVIQMAQNIGLSPNRLTRSLTLATRAKDPKRIDRILSLWEIWSRIAGRVKWILAKAKRVARRLF